MDRFAPTLPDAELERLRREVERLRREAAQRGIILDQRAIFNKARWARQLQARRALVYHERQALAEQAQQALAGRPVPPRRLYCHKGHAYAIDGTVLKGGQQRCNKCKRERQHELRLRAKLKMPHWSLRGARSA